MDSDEKRRTCQYYASCTYTFTAELRQFMFGKKQSLRFHKAQVREQSRNQLLSAAPEQRMQRVLHAKGVASNGSHTDGEMLEPSGQVLKSQAYFPSWTPCPCIGELGAVAL